MNKTKQPLPPYSLVKMTGFKQRCSHLLGLTEQQKQRQKLKISPFKEKKAIVHDYSTERNYAIHLRMSEWCPIIDSKGSQTTKMPPMRTISSE